MYTLAGHVAEALSKEPWEKLVAERLIGPLGMRNTGMINAIKDFKEIVTPYTLKNNKLKPIDATLIK